MRSKQISVFSSWICHRYVICWVYKMRHFIVSFDVWECKKMGITLVGFEVLMVTDLFGSLIAWFIRMTRNMIQLNFE